MLFKTSIFLKNFLSWQIDASSQTSASVDESKFLVTWWVFQNDIIDQVLFERVPSNALDQAHSLLHFAWKLRLVANHELHYFFADSQVPDNAWLVLFTEIYRSVRKLVEVLNYFEGFMLEGVRVHAENLLDVFRFE